MHSLWSLATALLLSAAPPERPEPQTLADRIDQHLGVRLKDARVPAAPLADDAELLRRLSLDLTGRIPVPRDVHDFLADKSPEKRRRLIDQLLHSPRYATHFANVWRALLLPEVSASRDARYFQAGFEAWLRERLQNQVGYDQLVRELVAAPLPASGQAPASVFRKPDQANPLAFYAVKEARPENLASTTSRLFLGIQLECAQCHDHPFARWSRDQFWSQAAFFAGLERQGAGLFAPLTEAAERRQLLLPNTTRYAKASYLDGTKPVWKDGLSTRVQLAEWITSPENPFFARAAVNRVWGQLFGAGLVEPVDDFNDQNQPSHPELLDDLARSFVASHFDLHYLIKAICLSQAYQRTSAGSHPGQNDGRLFARMTLKGLSGEQFFDSLALATSYREREPTRGAFEREGTSVRRQFLTQFAPQGKLSEPQTSILQALTLMNGKFVDEATSLEQSGTLSAVVEMPLADTAERLDALYVATLSRKPTSQEKQRLLKYVEKVDRTEQPRRLADVFWMLLNSSEFRLNH